ncbi:MAG: DNA polymerase III subunit gamma/tau [Verrucomicrobiae bacterium]|nr:DNA polymerase III subunit gamma/tau [Verrucomicrobiae bacterium]
MSYQVLARKYRPQRFEEVVGQEHVTQTLINAIKQGRIAHAYIFCGPRGTGKTTIARIFAKCLNCTGGPKVDFDDSDPRCIEIAEGRSMDVLEIDGASNNSVEQIRDLREAVRYAPAVSKFKIYIIDEVHMLTAAAFNALLKTLEEPPAHVKFFFATTDPEKVLPTILSRCQRFDLRRIPVSLIVKHLARIAEAEGIVVEEAALRAIARGADGAMRDAQSTLDQLISFCGKRIVEADVLSMFGLTARDQILALATAVCRGDVSAALKQLDNLVRNGKNLGRLLVDLLDHFRNLMVWLVSKGDTELLDVSEVELAVLREQSSLVNADTVGRILEVLTDAESRLRDAASKRILFEVTLLKACQAKDSVNIEAVLNRLVSLRDKTVMRPGQERKQSTAGSLPGRAETADSLSGTNVARVRDQHQAQGTTVSSNFLANATHQTPAEDLVPVWEKVLEAIKGAAPFVHSYLSKAVPVSLSGKTMVIGFESKNADYIPLINNDRTHSLVTTKLRELGVEVEHLRFQPIEECGTVSEAIQVSKQPTVAASKTEKVELPDVSNFEDDPLINAALEIFKGKIAGVQKQQV